MGALTLAVAGVLFIVGAVAGLQLHALAEDWRAAGSVPGDAIWLDARDAAGLVSAFGFFAMGALALSFASFVIVIARSRALPRGVGLPALAGGIVVVVCLPLLATGIEIVRLFLMAGMLSVAASFLLTAGWLTLRGTRRPIARRSAGAARSGEGRGD